MAESVEFNSQEQTSSENHDSEMASKYESQQDSGGDTSQNSQESQSTSETSDDTSQSEQEADNSQDSESEEKSEDDQKEPSKEDFDELQKEYAENGELSEESYQKLQDKYNLPKEVVDDYISKQTQAVQAVETAGYAVAGGKEQFQQMAEWAKQNLPEGEIQEFNEKVNSGDVEKAVEAVTNLRSRYTDAVGSEPELVEGQGRAPTAVGYQSRAELTRDMADPKYKNDPAFRAEVERKLRNSSIL